MVEIFDSLIDDQDLYHCVLSRLKNPDLSWEKVRNINYTDPGSDIEEPGEVCTLENEQMIIDAVTNGTMECFYILEDTAGEQRLPWNMLRIKCNRTRPLNAKVDAYQGAHIDEYDRFGQYRIFSCVYYPEDSDGELIIWDRRATDPDMDQDQVRRLLRLERPRVLLEMQPRKNRLVMFDARYYHRAMPPREHEQRLAINMVWAYDQKVVAERG
jgi:hypothetical protein